jgi:sensor histidine kinase YesM/ligand-binding sensor domain-containing protein
MPKKWILGLLFLFVATSGHADNNFYLRTYTQKDGLTYNLINKIARDKFGFLWIATWDGISRFDGYNFKNYKHTIKDSTSIPEYIIERLVIDTLDNIWIKTINKVAIYDRKNDCFSTFSKKNCPTFKFSSVYGLVRDINGTIWLSGDSGLSWFDQKMKAFKYLNIKVGGRYFFTDNKGDLYFGDKQLDKIQLNKLKDTNDYTIKSIFSFNFKANPVIRNLGNYLLTCQIFQDNKGRTWAYTFTGVYLLDEKGKSFLPYLQIPPYDKIEGGDPIYWSNNDQILNIYYPPEKRLIKIVLKKDEYPSACFFDQHGSVWYSSVNLNELNNGLVQYIETPSIFKHYLTDYDTNGKSISVSALIKDKAGNILVGSRNYNYIIKILSSGSLSKVNELDRKLKTLTKHPRSFAEDASGRIWIGYLNSLLSVYDPISGKCRKIILDPSESRFIFRVVHPLGNGNLLIGSGECIYLYDPDKGQFINNTPPGRHTFYCITRTHDGYLWAGSENGIILKMDSSLNSVREYKTMDQDEVVNVEEICETDSIYLWLATMGAGLCRFDRRDGSVKFFTTAQGLSDNVTYSVVKDKKNFLWISTNNRLSRFDPTSGNFKVFGEAEGLRIKEFNADASYQDPDGTVFFGGQGGVISFHPDSIREIVSKGNPLLLINNFTVNGEYLKGVQNIYNRTDIILGKGTNNFQAELVCTDLLNSQNIRYRYQLEGIDHNWTETDSRNRKISYSGLVPGNYLLTFEATNPNGEWTRSNRLHIKILPYLYQTYLFRIILTFLLTALVLGVIFLFFRRIRKKQLQEMWKMKQIQSDLMRRNELLRLESLQGQMNPHFLFNSLNSINYFVSISDKIAANQYITGFARLIRSILNNSKNQFITLEQEVESLEDYLKLEHIRFSDKFDYVLEVDEELLESGTEITPSMVQPFVENAIWHGIRYIEGRKGLLRVKFSPKNNSCIVCTVEDNGIGRSEAEKRKTAEMKNRRSRGIEIIREKLKIFNSLNQTSYTILISDHAPDQQETGTRVTIEIPAKFPEENP